MQTFLPYSSYTKSAQCLDFRRLGKQRVEGYQILRTLCGLSNGWKNHPAVKMWAGYEQSLLDYTLAMIVEWKKRGYKDTIHEKLKTLPISEHTYRDPPWLGDKKLHQSHQSNLLRKNKEYYSKFFGTEITDNLPYYWPIEKGEEMKSKII